MLSCFVFGLNQSRDDFLLEALLDDTLLSPGMLSFMEMYVRPLYCMLLLVMAPVLVDEKNARMSSVKSRHERK